MYMFKRNPIFSYLKKQNIVEQVKKHYTLYGFTYQNQPFKIYITPKANKATVIHCKDSGDIIWEQLYPFSGTYGGVGSNREKHFLLKPTFEKAIITIVVIKGKPATITGFGNGLFSSAYGKDNDKIFVMSEKEFGTFMI